MTLPLWTLLVASLLPYVWATLASLERKREFGAIDNHHPRLQQAKQTGAGARAYSASQNAFEALAVYAPAVLVAHSLAPASELAAPLALAWVAFRVAHGVFYVSDKAPARGVCFGLATACSVLLYLVAAHVL
jgi:uncharacterized MAPEG superfamily protein